MDEHNSHRAIAHRERKPANHKDGKNILLSQQEQSTLSKYSSLPWELRHHIHTFCVQGSFGNDVVVRQGTESRPALLVRQSTGAHSYLWIEDPIFQQLGPDRIGMEAAREVFDTYYRTRTFKFVHNELGVLRSFLETDAFNLGMRPADHVRRLHLQIQPFTYAQFQETRIKNQEESSCREALESLLVLQSPCTTIEIHADLAQGFSDDEDYEELLYDAAGFIFRTIGIVGTLRKKGLKIEVAFEGRWDGKDGTRMCSGSLPSLNDCMNSMRIACQ